MNLDWQLQARCRGSDPDGPFGSEPDQAVFALAFCGECPVRAECLRFGLETDSTGVFGGYTRRQRHLLVKKCSKERPILTEKRRRVRSASRITSQCGTTAGYRRHVHAKEQTCDRCRRAWADYWTRRRAA